MPAAVTVYTSRSAFEARLDAVYFQDFDTYAAQQSLASSVTFAGNGLSFTVSTDSGGGTGIGVFSDSGIVGSVSSSDQLVITPGAPTNGLGGNFFFTDFDFITLPASVFITLRFSDGSSYSFTSVISNASDYRGFIVDDGRLITRLHVNARDSFHYANMDNISIGFTAQGPVGATVFNDWVQAQFNTDERIDPAVSGPGADPDGDGFVNLLEYAFCSNPKSPDSLERPVSGLSEGALSIAFTRRKHASDLAYVVEVSDDLQTWSSGGSFTQERSVTYVDAERDAVVVTDRTPLADEGKRFIRLRVNLTE
jgi:hypothetical protein